MAKSKAEIGDIDETLTYEVSLLKVIKVGRTPIRPGTVMLSGAVLKRLDRDHYGEYKPAAG